MSMQEMALYRYVKPDGTFDYDQYVASQIRVNAKKLRRQWVRSQTIDTICSYLHKHIPAPKFGLCHGTRRGVEQAYFKQNLPGCEVLGTEISTTATQFPDTIRWDFHEIKPEWVNAADFVYTNSLDHAYDPHLAVDIWMQSLTDLGYCFVEWWQAHEIALVPVPVDCFKATVDCCRELFTEWGRLAEIPYSIVDILAPIGSSRRNRAPRQDGVVFVLAKDKE